MVRDEDIAQDLAQDTFLRAFQSLGSYRGEAEVTTWVLAIGRRLVFSRARRLKVERRWQVVTDVPPEDVGARGIVEPADPRLMDAVEALPLRQREAVVLFYLEDLGVEDIARMTGRPTNTIKSDLHRARAALRLGLGAASKSSTSGKPGTEASHE
jgi:RNA polymerase sigma-70 factor (ECF subfamily)